jgi:hypothetical protein
MQRAFISTNTVKPGEPDASLGQNVWTTCCWETKVFLEILGQSLSGRHL